MAFEDDAAKPKNRKFLYAGIAIHALWLVPTSAWRLAGSPAIPVLKQFGIVVLLVNIASLLAGSWFPIRHFRGPDRSFTPREKRYWASQALLFPFAVPLFVYIGLSVGKLGLRPDGGYRSVPPSELFSQPIPPWFGVTIAVCLAVGVILSLSLYGRNVDEQEHLANLRAAALSWTAMLFVTPIWHFLALGGLVAPVDLWWILGIGWVVFVTAFTKFKFF